MNPIKAWVDAHLLWFKVAGVLAILAAIGYGLWALHHAGVEAGRNQVQVAWDKDKIERDEAYQRQLTAALQKRQNAEAQHDKDQRTITNLRHQLDGVLHLPTCPAAASGAAHPDGEAGVLSNRVDEGFVRLQERARELFFRCDQLNIDAIRANGAQ